MNEPEKWIIIGLQPRSRSCYLSAIFSSTHKPTGSHINGFLEFLLPLPIPGKVPLIFILLFVYFNFYFTPVSFDWIFLRKQSPFSRNAHTSHFPLLYFIFFFLTTEDPMTNLETSDSAGIGLKTEKLNFCSHLYLTQSCAEKYLPAAQGSRPPCPCCDSL